MSSILRTYVILTLVVVSALTACSTSQANADNSSLAPAAQASPTPRSGFTESDVDKLKWIVGDWKGTGDVEKPFFERYRFVDKTTLAVDGFPDESFTKADDTTLFALKEGAFGNSGDARWAASEITGYLITFVPVAGVRNTFKWQRVSDNEWKAILDWPAAGDKPARQRVYKMERVKSK